MARRNCLFIVCACTVLGIVPMHVDAESDSLSPDTPCYSAIVGDWADQDNVASVGYREAIKSILETTTSPEKQLLQQRLDGLAGVSDEDSALIRLYIRACSARRVERMSGYIDEFQKVIFSQHDARGGAWYYHGLTYWRGYEGKGLDQLTMNGYYGDVEHLMPEGHGRDPAISFDGKRVLFGWKEEKWGPYNIYEMDLETRNLTQITEGNWSDIEPAYLPNGKIIFNSARIVQDVDCASGNNVVNLFICEADGAYPRRIGFDQAPTNYPVVMPTGEIVYCRWDYNDKSHTYAHALFIMNPDGTAQREYYNNNSWWPSMILHQRVIPGTNKLMAMIGGYHLRQQGRIGIIDRSVGMQHGQGLTLLCPVRAPKDDTLMRWGRAPKDWPGAETFVKPGEGPRDQWSKEPPHYAYPYPFDENAFLVSFRPESKTDDWKYRFGLYFMTSDGQRELLHYDPEGSCCAPVVVKETPTPPIIPPRVNYADSTGVFTMSDVYVSQSPVLDGVERGTIKRLRVAYLEYRTGPGLYTKGHCGPGGLNNGGASYQMAIATPNASWDVKGILGETPVYEDGSASFRVPARTPIFFQALDENGEVVQTMRSWATLQPGETFACVGCHESQLETPPVTGNTIASKNGPRDLEPFYGPPRGFSFIKEIQPILDAKCVECHNATKPNGINLSGDSDREEKRYWTHAYLNLTEHEKCDNFSKYVSWFHAESSPLLQPPYRAGSVKSPLLDLLEKGHEEVVMTKEEMDKIRCWIDIGVPFAGDYTEALYEDGRRKVEEMAAKRRAFEKIDSANIAALVETTPVFGNRRTSGSSTPHSVFVNGLTAGPNGTGVLHLMISSGAGEIENIRINLHDATGRLVRRISVENAVPGLNTIPVNDFGQAELPVGMYFCRISGAGSPRTARLVYPGR